MNEDPIMEGRSMEGLAPYDMARRAIRYALLRIKEEPHIAWYCGPGTHAWALLTEAAAAIDERDVSKLRHDWLPPKSIDPKEEGRQQAIKEAMDGEVSCGPRELNLLDSDILDFIADASTHGRLTLLHDIRHRFCGRCGGDQGEVGMPCRCNIGARRKPRAFA